MVNSGREKFADYMATQQPIEYNEGVVVAERIWSRSWLPSLYNKDKKYLLILGDAITEGMSYYYEEFMGEEWSVHRQTGSISVCDEFYNYRLGLALTAARKEYSAIVFTPTARGDETPEQFEKAVNSAVEKIKELQPNSKLIIAANTMVNPIVRGKNININIFGYNKNSQLLATRIGVEFVDLGALSQKILADHTPDGVMFTDMGYKKMAFEVIKYIK